MPGEFDLSVTVTASPTQDPSQLDESQRNAEIGGGIAGGGAILIFMFGAVYFIKARYKSDPVKSVGDA